MARFTKLSNSDLATLAREFNLGVFLSGKRIEAGTVNSNYCLESEHGRFFLRVNEGKREPDVQFEIAVLSLLCEGGVKTPMPLRSLSGVRYTAFAGKYISVFPWALGSHGNSQTISNEQCRAVGRALGNLHIAGEGAGFAREGRYTGAKVRLMFDAFAKSQDPVLHKAISVLTEEFSRVGESSLGGDNLPRGLIHADLFPDNVLLQGDSVSALLDFEQACVGLYCYDLAVLLNAWCFAEALVPSRARAMLEGYLLSRELSVAELQALPGQLRVAALRFSVTRIRDVYLSQPSGGAAGKDFRRFLMRLEAWRAIGAQDFADLAVAFS